MYISACPTFNCSVAEMFPYPASAEVGVTAYASAAYHLNRELCFSQDTSVDCNVYVGVFVRVPTRVGRWVAPPPPSKTRAALGPV
jgi:hypothetical protein